MTMSSFEHSTTVNIPPPVTKRPTKKPQTVQLFKHEPLLLDCGQPLNDVQVAYHTYGEPKEEAVLVLHALTGDSAVHEWWPQFLGEGKLLDPTKEYIICSNVLGGCAGTSGLGDLPQLEGQSSHITLRDMARVGRALLEHLGVKRVKVIGASMGGMLTYAWLLECPDLIERAVIIGAPGRHSPWAIGLNTAQRNAIRNSPGGEGLKLARQIAMISYRSFDSFQAKQSGERSPGVPAITSYLNYQGEKLESRFNEETYCTLTQAMDLFQPSDFELRCIQAPVLTIGISSDVLYPAAEVKQYAELLPNSQYHELDSIHGHDAFLMDAQDLPEVIGGFLAEGSGA